MSVMDTTRSWAQWFMERWHIEESILTSDSVHSWWILGVVFAVFLLMQTRLWTQGINLKLWSTIVHELGHTIVALFTGRKLHGIKVHSDSSGVSVSSGKPYGVGMVLVTLAGYPAPTLLALGMAYMGSIGYAGASLLIYNIALVFALFLSRNIRGFIAIISALLFTGVVTYLNYPEVISWTVVLLVVFYSLSSIQDVLDLWRVHYSHFDGSVRKELRKKNKENSKNSDAYQAFKLTLIPSVVWIIFFAAIALIGAFVSIWLLIS